MEKITNLKYLQPGEAINFEYKGQKAILVRPEEDRLVAYTNASKVSHKVLAVFMRTAKNGTWKTLGDCVIDHRKEGCSYVETHCPEEVDADTTRGTSTVSCHDPAC